MRSSQVVPSWLFLPILLFGAPTLGVIGEGTDIDHVYPQSSIAEPAPNLETCAVTSTSPREVIHQLIRSHLQLAGDSWRLRLADAIYTEARAAGTDPLLVASIAAVESSFRSRVVSPVGAVGLMQLRPFVARDVAERRSVTWDGTETLHQPELNVRLGVLYYLELVDRFDGDVQMALTAYNRGPSRVSRQVRSGSYSGSRYSERILDLYDELRRSVG